MVRNCERSEILPSLHPKVLACHSPVAIDRRLLGQSQTSLSLPIAAARMSAFAWFPQIPTEQ